MDKIDKAKRLELLKQIGQRQLEKENLIFAGLDVSKNEIAEDIHSTDAFREEHRDRASGRHAINSDEI